jgi:hypothetical protein
MKRLYLYLASKSKKGMKLVTVLQTETITSSRLTDLKTLKLPQLWERKIQQIVHDNRMSFDPWVETAADFNELRQRLRVRGYTDLPMGAAPMLAMPAYSLAPKADVSGQPVVRTMLRKAK